MKSPTAQSLSPRNVKIENPTNNQTPPSLHSSREEVLAPSMESLPKDKKTLGAIQIFNLMYIRRTAFLF